MAHSWNELSSNHKYVFLLEGLLRNKKPDPPMACRICDQIYTDNKSLIDHFQSHFNQENGSHASSENGAAIELISSSTQSTKDSVSLAVPENASTNSAANSGGARDSVPSNPPNPNLKPHTLKWKETTLPHKRPSFYPYPARSIIRSGNVNSSVRPVTPVTTTSQLTNFCFSSYAGTSSIARGMTTGSVAAAVGQNEMENVANVGYTKPFIMQLEQRPIPKVVLVNNDVGNPDEMIDLTLKL